MTDPKETAQRQFREAGFDLQHPLIAKFLDLCMAIQDLPRHLGQHSGGMVICQGQLDSVVPLEPATHARPRGRAVGQGRLRRYGHHQSGSAGPRHDGGAGRFASSSFATIIGEEVDLAHLPQDDPLVYEALQKADTIGHVSSGKPRADVLPSAPAAGAFYDIVVQVAIIRPGPIVGKMLNPFLRRRQGREKPECLHPSLEPVLARTLGVPLFQEQLLRMAMIVADFTGGEAEELRRAMGFKRSQARMVEIETRLRDGMQRKGILGKRRTPSSNPSPRLRYTDFRNRTPPVSH